MELPNKIPNKIVVPNKIPPLGKVPSKIVVPNKIPPPIKVPNTISNRIPPSSKVLNKIPNKVSNTIPSKIPLPNKVPLPAPPIYQYEEVPIPIYAPPIYQSGEIPLPPIREPEITYPIIYRSFVNRLIDSFKFHKERINEYNDKNLLTSEDYDNLIFYYNDYINKLINIRDASLETLINFKDLLDQMEFFVNEYYDYSQELTLYIGQITENIKNKNKFCGQFKRQSCPTPCKETHFFKRLISEECDFPLGKSDIKRLM